MAHLNQKLKKKHFWGDAQHPVQTPIPAGKDTPMALPAP